MKKLIVLCSIVVVILVLAFLFINSCGSEKCTEPTSPDYYHIRFTLDGSAINAQDIILNFGGDVDDPTLVWWPNLGWIEMEGFYCGGGTDAAFPTFKLWVQPRPSTPGEFEGEYGGSGTPIGFVNATLTIFESGTEYDYLELDGILTITAFGDVGGDVVGTFDFTFEPNEEEDPAPSFGSPLTATGEFRVLRAPDDPYSPD